MVNQMKAISQVLLKELQSACKTINLHRTKPLLGVRDDCVIEADAPLMTLMEKYKLPLKTNEEVELLEIELKNSHDFLKYFVSMKLLHTCSFHRIQNTSKLI